MRGGIYYSSQNNPVSWDEIQSFRDLYGSKAAGLAALPRQWTPPFILLSTSLLSSDEGTIQLQCFDALLFDAIKSLARDTGKIIVRSSVIGETIWDRGSYLSKVVELRDDESGRIISAAKEVIASSAPNRSGLILQTYINVRAQGEFGNILRVAKSREHWQLTWSGGSADRQTIRFNSQRDIAAAEDRPLPVESGKRPTRLFASVGAWFNNVLVRGTAIRLSCEWVSDLRRFYIVQADQEDEDIHGINPFQVTLPVHHAPMKGNGVLLKRAGGENLQFWDKLSVLTELFEPNDPNTPALYYVELSELQQRGDAEEVLRDDFAKLIGPDGVVVRTSVRSGAEKVTNLPRTDGLSPENAARWCMDIMRRLQSATDICDLAFVTHRFIAARAAAWARAEPGNPIVEINSLWGLPDGLQYCPYDIWEIHIPTQTATEYPDYKSHALLARSDGSWDIARIKNEVARSMSVRKRDALEIANRTSVIAEKLQKSIHLMWFVEAQVAGGTADIPWYWTEAHPAQRNLDRDRYKLVSVRDRGDLNALASTESVQSQLALSLVPRDPSLFRDNKFLSEVAEIAKSRNMPVVIAGSTLAHAYYVLTKSGCTVIAVGGKEHSRIRKSAVFGKIVRDKIPGRIEGRREASIVTTIPDNLKIPFLISKLLEEAFEFVSAESNEDRLIELADMLEVVRGMASAVGVKFSDVLQAADQKRDKAGGFDSGYVLQQTGIRVGEGASSDVASFEMQVLAKAMDDRAFEIPFTFFGFAGLNHPRHIVFDQGNIRLEITLKADRLVIRLGDEPEQLDFLDMTVDEPDKERSGH
jgi:predicted house-cleaning noncanonical NTP pyrophosphatase (MazG superfamily)